MKNDSKPAVALCILALAIGCAPAAEQPAEQAAAPTVEEIPVTSSSPEALTVFHAGEALLDVGRALEANARFREATEIDPEFSYAYLNQANAAQSAQEYKESLDKAVASLEGKSEGERLMVEINQTFISNDADQRMALSKALVKQYPNSPRAWLNHAGMQGSLSRHEAARKSIGKALALDPDLVASHSALGFSYLFNEPKDFAIAKASMEKCIELDPEEAKGYEFLGDAHRAMKDLEQARAAYTMATTKDPALAVAQLKKGHVNSFLGNYDEARADYDAALATADVSNRPSFSNYRAFVNIHAGDDQAAIDEMGEILASIDGLDIPEAQKPGNKTFTLTNMASVALHHDMTDKAEKILGKRAKVVRANAESVGDSDFSRQQEADILIWEGLLAARRGNYEEAAAKAEESRALVAEDSNPRKDEGYHGLMGYIALLEGSYPEAAEHYGQANPNAVFTQYYLAAALEGAGNTEEAKALFKKVAEFNFNDVAFALVRPDAMARAGA